MNPHLTALGIVALGVLCAAFFCALLRGKP